ncbi:MAG: hypothetical protein H5T72_02860 [Actinobacteria bacterium]|nr:hypothetical protein [Actinomycetota bacterium]
MAKGSKLQGSHPEEGEVSTASVASTPTCISDKLDPGKAKDFFGPAIDILAEESRRN